MPAMSRKQQEWGRRYQYANQSLQHSAFFYISARRLLVWQPKCTLIPGLVCGAYSLEHLLKALLRYDGQSTPKGNDGHKLVDIAKSFKDRNFSSKIIEQLELFENYFQARYHDNKYERSLSSSDYELLDRLYYEFYRELNIPTSYHSRLGVYALVYHNQGYSQAIVEEFESNNKYTDWYKGLAVA